jgi:hypothetical protein
LRKNDFRYNHRTALGGNARDVRLPQKAKLAVSHLSGISLRQATTRKQGKGVYALEKASWSAKYSRE